VTIAAGFICEDGLLMCADTQYTSEDRDKGEGLKIFPKDFDGMQFLFSGAGDRSLIAMTVDIMSDAIETKKNTLLQMNLQARMEAIRRIVTQRNQFIYSRYLAYASQPVPAAEMLIGFLSREGDDCEFRLLRAGNTTVERIQEFECVGTGAPLGNWLARIFYNSEVPIELFTVAALYIVQEAKANIPFCGGGTHVYALKRNTDKVKKMRVWDDEQIARDVQDAMRDAIYLTRDLSYNESVFTTMLDARIKKWKDMRFDALRSVQGMPDLGQMRAEIIEEDS
jgi:hypothetical protein